MKYLSHIAIALFILVNTLYDFIDIPKNTGLTIMFFAGTYGSLLIWTISEFLREKDVSRMYFGAMSIGLGLKLALELSKIGMDYRVYMNSINNYEQSLLFVFMMIALLLAVVQNGRSKNNNRNNRSCD